MSKQTLIKEIKTLFNEIHELTTDTSSALSLPENTYFLKMVASYAYLEKTAYHVSLMEEMDLLLGYTHLVTLVSTNQHSIYFYLQKKEKNHIWPSLLANKEKMENMKRFHY